MLAGRAGRYIGQEPEWQADYVKALLAAATRPPAELAALSEGDVLSLRDVLPTQHFTEPPPRFSEGSLVKRLEELGVGRPSTYSGIMKVRARA